MGRTVDSMNSDGIPTTNACSLDYGFDVNWYNMNNKPIPTTQQIHILTATYKKILEC